MATERIVGADFVRASACLMVLGHHLAQRLNPGSLPALLQPAYPIVLKGLFGVGVFFVLSGFLLARPFWRALDASAPMPSLRVYALRRVARIVPGFWLALTVTFILDVTIFNVPLDPSLTGRFLAGFFLVSDWHWSTLFPIEYNGPLWSIGFEVTSYVLLPATLVLLFWLRVPRIVASRMVWLVVIVATTALSAAIVAWLPVDRSGVGWQFGLQGGAKVWVPRFNPIGFFAIFAIGALAAGAQVRFARFRSAAFDVVALAGAALAIGSILTTMHGEGEGYGLAGIPYGYPWFPLGVAIILAALPSSVLLGRAAEHPVFVFIARISFGIYVWHYLIIETARQLRLPHLTMAGLAFGPWLRISAVVVAASIAMGLASYYWLEQPIIRWARDREPRLRARGARGRGGIVPKPAAES